MGLINFSLGDIGSLFKDIREAITGKAIEDPNKKADLLMKLNEAELVLKQAQSKIIEAEAKSEHWITSAWRPITMLVFVFIIANNYILVPYFQAFGLKVPSLELNQQMWELLKIGIGGYIVGRSAEKITKQLKGLKNAT
jgi:hypothetical protein